MKEWTPDPDVAKVSVFHRLVQRAFPGWFAFDSVGFFHQFYTLETNSRFARKQGYQGVFKLELEKNVHKNSSDLDDDGYEFDYTRSLPKKPAKPVYLSNYAQVKSVPRSTSDNFANPACTDAVWFPRKVAKVLIPGMTRSKAKSVVGLDLRIIQDWFTALTRDIAKREVISVDAEKPIYQIDVTRA